MTNSLRGPLLAGLAIGAMALAAPAFAQDEGAKYASPTADCTGVTYDKIGYSPLTMQFDYFQFIESGIKQIADQCKVQVLTADPNNDATKQVSDVESLIAAGAKTVSIYSIDPKAVETAVDAAKAAGVKVLAAVSVFDGADVSVGISDHEFGYQEGLLAGPILLKDKPGRDSYNVAILNADSLGSNLLDRKKGLTDGLTAAGVKFTVVSDVEAWAEDTALNATETLLQAHPDVDLILTVNDPGSLGAESAVEAAGNKSTIVMGLGIDKRVLQGVLDGTFPGSVSPAPIETGRALAAVSFALNRGDKVPANVVVPVVTITKDNAQAIMDSLYKK
ncbi:MAG TPA: sugar ABC transporter substrate-binding protein [Devosia sp.]|nr:sugar ABC transporter substrate-binding protein [Devosia sp.]